MHGRHVMAVVATTVLAGGMTSASVIASDRDDVDSSATKKSLTPTGKRHAAPMALVCSNELRTTGTADYFAPPRGQPTPASAVEGLVDRAGGESVVITRDDRGRHAWIMRADRTARAKLDLSYYAQTDSWYFETFEGCGDEPLPGNLPKPHSVGAGRQGEG